MGTILLLLASTLPLLDYFYCKSSGRTGGGFSLALSLFFSLEIYGTFGTDYFSTTSIVSGTLLATFMGLSLYDVKERKIPESLLDVNFLVLLGCFISLNSIPEAVILFASYSILPYFYSADGKAVSLSLLYSYLIGGTGMILCCTVVLLILLLLNSLKGNNNRLPGMPFIFMSTVPALLLSLP